MKKPSEHSSEHNYYKIVLRHRQEYFQRPALQAIYKHWAHRMKQHLSDVKGLSIELGCGCGALSQHLNLTKTDIYKHDWVDQVADACNMPYTDGECANLAAVDMLHHLPDTCLFFDEVSRTLTQGGRLILLEPYVGPLSYLFYRFLHHEPVDRNVSPFEPISSHDKESGETCNEAIPTLLFIKHREEFLRRWPKLRIILLEFSDMLIYPLTGGFSHPSLVPTRLIKPLMKLEDTLMKKTGRLLAMRLLVVIEKKQT